MVEVLVKGSILGHSNSALSIMAFSARSIALRYLLSFLPIYAYTNVAGFAEKSVFPDPGTPYSATWKASGFPSLSDRFPAAVDSAGKRHMVAAVCHDLGNCVLTNVCINLGNFFLGQGNASASMGCILRFTFDSLAGFVSMWLLLQLMSPIRSSSLSPRSGKCLRMRCLLLVICLSCTT